MCKGATDYVVGICGGNNWKYAFTLSMLFLLSDETSLLEDMAVKHVSSMLFSDQYMIGRCFHSNVCFEIAQFLAAELPWQHRLCLWTFLPIIYTIVTSCTFYVNIRWVELKACSVSFKTDESGNVSLHWLLFVSRQCLSEMFGRWR